MDDLKGASDRAPYFWLYAYPISALRPSQVNLGEESHGDQVPAMKLPSAVSSTAA
jgi:hypothetical protein